MAGLQGLIIPNGQQGMVQVCKYMVSARVIATVPNKYDSDGKAVKETKWVNATIQVTKFGEPEYMKLRHDIALNFNAAGEDVCIVSVVKLDV